MEACGFSFILHHAPLLASQVLEHFCKKVFQIFLIDCPVGVGTIEFAPAQVECCAELVCRAVYGILIHAA